MKSCAGVILTAPVPFSGSEYSSATIGISRPTSGSTIILPTRASIALILGMHGDAGVAQHGLWPRGGDDDVLRRIVLQRVAEIIEVAVGIAVEDLRQRLGVERLLGITVMLLPRLRRTHERAALLDLNDLEVGDRGLELGVPIDEALILVDEPWR